MRMVQACKKGSMHASILSLGRQPHDLFSSIVMILFFCVYCIDFNIRAEENSSK